MKTMGTIEVHAVGLDDFLSNTAEIFASGGRPAEIVGRFGVHGVTYSEEDGEVFASVGFVVSRPGIYAEIEGGTFGELQAFRFDLGLGWTCDECGEPCEGDLVSDGHDASCSLHSANVV